MTCNGYQKLVALLSLWHTYFSILDSEGDSTDGSDGDT